MIYGIRTFPPTIAPSPDNCFPRNFPQGNCPQILSPQKITPEQVPRTTTPGESLPMKFSQRQLLIPGLFPPENYTWIIPPWTVTPMEFPIGLLTPGLLPLEHFSLNNSSLNNYPRATNLRWNSSRKWQRIFTLENYPLIIYRCRSKKVLSTHSSLEILNKFWKKIKQGAVHTTSWRYFTLKKSFL